MQAITSKVPGMDQMMGGMMGGSKEKVQKEKILIDENFSNKLAIIIITENLLELLKIYLKQITIR